MASSPVRLLLLLQALLLLAPLLLVAAQSTSLSSPTPSVTVSLTTGSVTVTLATSRPGAQPSTFVTVLPGVVSNVTITLTPSSTSSSTSLSSTTTTTTAASAASHTPDPFVLETKVDPAFGVLGVVLILTGLPSAFWGHKNRWTSFFLIGFYTLSLVCFVLILKFGVLPAINPPSKTLRGLFVLACSVAGIAGGGIAIFFWKGTRYTIGAWGGFAFALWIQCFHNGGLIKAVGIRWILYIVCGVIGFSLSTIPKIHYHVLLISTAFVGATSFMLGVDCFTTAGLKEFYIWNLGFRSLFPKFTNNGIQFPVSQTMQIELGLTGAVALMGIAVQLRIIKVLQKKMDEIAEDTNKLDEEAEVHAADRLKVVEGERDEWEKEHPTLSKHGRNDSQLSSMPLMKDHREGSHSPLGDDRSSYLGRPRHVSGLSDFRVAPTSEDDMRRASRFSQSPGVLPSMDLGSAIEEDVPSSFIAEDVARTVEVTPAELEDYKRKQSLLVEIQNIRRSIDILKSETPIPPSSSEQSLRPSFASKRTLSMDAGNTLLPATSLHARPPREAAPSRARVHSLEFSSLARNTNSDEPISRPTSVPLKDDWDTYINERKLLQPPAGVTPPIATTPLTTHHRPPIPPAVQEALQRRKQRESMLNMATNGTDSSEDVPLARVVQQQKHQQQQLGPVTILPPRRNSSHIVAPVPQVAAPRTRTFEELTERHREKMRDMQAPLTQAEKEHAELEAARQRWERSKALEREAVTRRQAEKAAALEKRKKSGPSDGGETARPGRSSMNEVRSGLHAQRHSRSLSADMLGGGSRRLSTLKVEDWQRHQQDAEMGVKSEHHAGGGAGASSKRDSRNTRSGVEGVPFPHDHGKGQTQSRRKSRDFLS
ncbi:hypothetical protein BDN70DRAFT_816276 [Pholiota conissans]|uniref:TM7S3/TM198-like domain-containing protein n=1 Tax=Pholiota conissans TaxID=109636 RepID=A0A9P5YT27_9AGAR|nr:hypothetical protein BDN70DRAFT_816276 [Pholiota conissans]